MARPTEEIKDRLDLVEFIKGYIEVRPAGKNFKALCPFHQEKTPSFMISPERGMWHCFGCGEGGDIFKFLMRYENLEFYEALRVLAEKAGVELKRLSPADQRQFGVLYDINSSAAAFFENALEDSKEARAYIKKRGIRPETLREFIVGFAPHATDELTVFLINQGFTIADIVRSGLALKTERGQHIDRFRGRLMFPIHNHFGKVIGFSGRVLPEFDNGKMGKYINSPDSPIFNKSRILYGFWQSKTHIREEEAVLLVEGQTDFLLTWQDNVKNVVATSGTALTGDHLRVLRRSAKKIIMGFDADEAGRAAAERNIDLAATHDFTVYILDLGEFEDPAEAAAKKPGFLKEAMGRARTGMEYYFERYLTPEALLHIESKKVAVRAVLMKIKALWSPVERSHWVHELAHRSGIHEEQLIEELEKLSYGEDRGERDKSSDSVPVRDLTRIDMIAEQMLGFAAGDDRFREQAARSSGMVPSRYQAVLAVITGTETNPSPEVQRLADIITLQSGLLFSVIPEEKLEAEFQAMLRELTLEYLRRERARIGAAVSAAEEAGDEQKAGELLRQFDDVLRKMQDIENASQETHAKS